MGNWKLASPDQTLALDVDASGATGTMNGTLNCLGISYRVTGGWDASGSVPGRNFSAFALSGDNGATAPNWIAATGIMTGPGNAPTQIDIQVEVSSSSDGTLNHYKGVLVPA